MGKGEHVRPEEVREMIDHPVCAIAPEVVLEGVS
jgi:hypothetical protein